MKRICLLLIFFLSTALISYANMETENWSMNKSFYDCLNTCTDYDSIMNITYNDGSNTETYERTIKKYDNTCQVVFSQKASSKNPPADAGGTADIYQFPMRVIKHINADNFDNYAKKYYDTKNSF